MATLLELLLNQYVSNNEVAYKATQVIISAQNISTSFETQIQKDNRTAECLQQHATE